MMAGSEVAGTRAHGSDHGFGGDEVIVEVERDDKPMTRPLVARLALKRGLSGARGGAAAPRRR
jgi:hypothetical protein